MPSSMPAGLVPHIVVTDANGAIEFYKKAFAATEVRRAPAPDGKRLMHAEVLINGSPMFLCDYFPEYCKDDSFRPPQMLGGSPMVLHQTVEDCDASMKRAADAGAKITMPASDQFWGDRYGQLTDPYGYVWSFSTPLKK